MKVMFSISTRLYILWKNSLKWFCDHILYKLYYLKARCSWCSFISGSALFINFMMQLRRHNVVNNTVTLYKSTVSPCTVVYLTRTWSYKAMLKNEKSPITNFPRFSEGRFFYKTAKSGPNWEGEGEMVSGDVRIPLRKVLGRLWD